MSIAFVRATLHDSTNAIGRAIEACGDRFGAIEVLCWDRLGTTLPREEHSGGAHIRRFRWKCRSRSLSVLLGLSLYQFWLVYHLVRIRPRVIQGLDFESMLAVNVARLLVRASTVYDMRDPFADCYAFPGWLRSFAYVLDWMVMGGSSAFVLPAAERREYLGRWGRSRKPVAVILNTCADELPGAGAAQRISRQDGAVAIGYFGYLSPSRGAYQLLDLCDRAGGAVRLHVAGKLRFEKLSRDIEASAWATFLGCLPRREALDLMRDVDVVALLYDPAVPVNRAAAPNKLYEALCMGTPVLVNRGMSLSATVEEAGLGWLVDYGDPAQLCRVVQDLRDPQKMDSLRKRCRQYYLEHCSYETEMQKYAAFYARLAARSPDTQVSTPGTAPRRRAA